MAALPSAVWLAVPLAALLAACSVWIGVSYARRRGLIDAPGQRRSHRAPTPRGGGIGIVVALLLAVCLPMLASGEPAGRALAAAVMIGLIDVAAIGWLDDHRPVAARWRLLVHILAAVILTAVLWRGAGAGAGAGWMAAHAMVALAAPVAAVLAIAWSINLHNFMDGSNGLLALQSIFVFVAFAALAGAHDSLFALGCLTAAAAVAGFLPFNFPHARVFMGDVGSGALGFMVAAAAAIGIRLGVFDLFEVALCASAFAVDATATLLSRMLRGRRWYSAHREHLYQWLVRVWGSHTRVAAAYVGWNLLVVAPLLIALRFRLLPPLETVVGVYVAAACLWWAGKRACLSVLRSARAAHAFA